jgi:hypothetical protein
MADAVTYKLVDAGARRAVKGITEQREMTARRVAARLGITAAA